MPRITVQVYQQETMETGVLAGTPRGVLGTEGVVNVGTFAIRGTAHTLRLLSTALLKAANQADAHELEVDE